MGELSIYPRLQKRAHNKGTKPRSYVPGDKIWFNSKYIQIKQNLNVKTKFFGPFLVLYLVEKQVYKLELPKKWKIHDVFHVSLPEHDTTRKWQMDENVTEFETSTNEDYEMEEIWNTTVYAKKSAVGHLLGLYYLISWKGYSKKENN